MEDKVCADVSIDIVLVDNLGFEAEVLIPIRYMNLVQDSFRDAFKDPRSFSDPWSIAVNSAWKRSWR